MCRFSGYRFRLFFLEQGIKRRQIFWSRLSKHVKRGNFVRTGYYLVKFLCFGVYFSPIFSRTGYHLKGKILELGENIFLSWAHPRTNLGQVPPPPGELLKKNLGSFMPVSTVFLFHSASAFLLATTAKVLLILISMHLCLSIY